MNDAETKVMTFTGVSSTTLPVTGVGATGSDIPTGNIASMSWNELLSQSNSPSGTGSGTLTPGAGRIFFAGMMFDRLRVRSVSLVVRPLVLPSSTTTGNPTITLYAAWDRYGGEETGSNQVPTATSITSDPSAKAVTWTAGGSGSTLRTWIHSVSRDRYQYMTIQHLPSLVSWTPQSAQLSEVFSPKIYFVAMGQNTVTSPLVQFQILIRCTIEFQGGYSSTSLNFPGSANALSLAAADSTDSAQLYTLTQRIRDFQKENPDE